MGNILFIDLTNFSDLMGLFGVSGTVTLITSIVLAILKGSAAKKGDSAKEAKLRKATRYCLIFCGLCMLLTAFSFMASMSEYTRSGRF